MALHRPQRAGGIATPRLNLVLFLYGLLTTAMLIHSSFKGAPKASGGERASDDKLLARIDKTLGAVDSLVKNLPAQGGAAAAVAAKPQVGPVDGVGWSSPALWRHFLAGSALQPGHASAAATAAVSAGLPGVPQGLLRRRGRVWEEGLSDRGLPAANQPARHIRQAPGKAGKPS